VLHNKNHDAVFKHFDLQIFSPDSGSDLTVLMIKLDYLRKKRWIGATHTAIFSQLKLIFSMLDSIGSARLEGNHTTIGEYVEIKLKNKKSNDEKIIEIRNYEEAIGFIEKNVKNKEINRNFLGEIHKIIVKNLNREGSKSPGEYRKSNLLINGSNHRPPDYIKVTEYMNELIGFINKKTPRKYDLLKTAIVHHRFVWIHPFDNGNSRTVRLLTYAMLLKLGAKEDAGRIWNPTAIFCDDRKSYYEALSWADEGTEEGILKWGEYFLSGLKKEIEKIDRMLDYEYLSKTILTGAVDLARKRKSITNFHKKLLLIAIDKPIFMSSDVEKLYPGKNHSYRGIALIGLRKEKLITTLNNKTKKYIIRLSNNHLLRSLIEVLSENGFIPFKE